MIDHGYCKGDCLIPSRVDYLSDMPHSFPLTLEVLRFSDGPDLRCMESTHD